MKTKELFREMFNLAVRLLGLVMLYQGIRALAFGHPVADAVSSAAVFVAAACWLFCGAYPVARWAYPETGADEGAAQRVGASSPKKADA